MIKRGAIAPLFYCLIIIVTNFANVKSKNEEDPVHR